LSFQTIAAVKNITLTANEWPPYTSDNIEDGGLVIELVTAAFAMEGIKTSYQIMPWARAIASVDAHEIDAVAAWDSAERRKKFRYSDRILINKMVLVKRAKEHISWNIFDDLESYTFVLVRGAVSLPEIDDSTKLNKTYVTTEESAMNLVAKGRADLTIRDQGIVEYLIKKKPELFFGKINFVEKTLGQNSLYLITSRQHRHGAEIINAFNQGLKKIQQNGTYRKLLEKYGNTLY